MVTQLFRGCRIAARKWFSAAQGLWKYNCIVAQGFSSTHVFPDGTNNFKQTKRLFSAGSETGIRRGHGGNNTQHINNTTSEETLILSLSNTTVSDKKLATEFHQRGYLTKIPVFTASELELLRQYLEWIEASKGPMFFPDEPGHRFPTTWVHCCLEHQLLWDMVVGNKIILDLARAIFKTNNIAHISSTAFVKHPLGKLERPKKVGWHQDLRFWGLDPGRVCTAWIAIDDSTIDNGCMHVVAESHLEKTFVEHDIVNTEGIDGPENVLQAYQDINESRFDTTKIRPLELRPGEASFHDGYLIHGSGPNLSENRRMGITLQLMPADVCASEEFVYDNLAETNSTLSTADWRQLILVSGQDPHGKSRVGRPMYPRRPFLADWTKFEEKNN